MKLNAKGDTIKQHCEGYYEVNKDKERIFKESPHAKKSKSRQERQPQQAPPVQVCFGEQMSQSKFHCLLGACFAAHHCGECPTALSRETGGCRLPGEEAAFVWEPGHFCQCAEGTGDFFEGFDKGFCRYRQHFPDTPHLHL